MLIKTLDKYDLKEMFRLAHCDHFSYDACEKFLELDEQTYGKTEHKFDPIDYDCEFIEYSESELIEEYTYLLKEKFTSDEILEMDNDEKLEEILACLNYNTLVYELTNSYLIQEW